jgi:hypothetical protein
MPRPSRQVRSLVGVVEIATWRCHCYAWERSLWTTRPVSNTRVLNVTGSQVEEGEGEKGQGQKQAGVLRRR